MCTPTPSCFSVVFFHFVCICVSVNVRAHVFFCCTSFFFQSYLYALVLFVSIRVISMRCIRSGACLISSKTKGVLPSPHSNLVDFFC
mmetsp:Transcript_42942/g.110877  ORF Transcript_42942/g.110877 Transcript_42942/m.110877 type:complete len:87 (+) Transcript_42942:1687-1947(+)